jgi:metal-responsive CopG/Arc/MetJ family transcriptional regulator
MNQVQISIRMPYSLLDEINGYMEKTVLSKTEVVVRAITSYLQLQEENSLEQRMAKLEAKIIKMEKQLKTI